MGTLPDDDVFEYCSLAGKLERRSATMLNIVLQAILSFSRVWAQTPWNSWPSSAFSFTASLTATSLAEGYSFLNSPISIQVRGPDVLSNH